MEEEEERSRRMEMQCMLSKITVRVKEVNRPWQSNVQDFRRQEHYTGDEPTLKPFDGIPRPLNTPITPEEVSAAAKCLKNGKAIRPDNILNELLKHAPDEFYKQYAELVNEVFERRELSNLSLRDI
jgi:hypothetical protein